MRTLIDLGPAILWSITLTLFLYACIKGPK